MSLNAESCACSVWGLIHSMTKVRPKITIRDVNKFTAKYRKPTICFVGSNPSTASPDNSAFHSSTASRKIVDTWIPDMQNYGVFYMNIADYKTQGNRAFNVKKHVNRHKSKLLQKFINHYNIKYIACGKSAGEALDMLGVRNFKMPHPSGLNRFWNDKEAGEAKLNELREWVLK